MDVRKVHLVNSSAIKILFSGAPKKLVSGPPAAGIGCKKSWSLSVQSAGLGVPHKGWSQGVSRSWSQVVRNSVSQGTPPELVSGAPRFGYGWGLQIVGLRGPNIGLGDTTICLGKEHLTNRSVYKNNSRS